MCHMDRSGGEILTMLAARAAQKEHAATQALLTGTANPPDSEPPACNRSDAETPDEQP